jgi:hypothetical protein
VYRKKIVCPIKLAMAMLIVFEVDPSFVYPDLDKHFGVVLLNKMGKLKKI